MRLLKLIALGLASYTIYELGRGILSMAGHHGHAQPQGGDARPQTPAQEADVRRRVLSGSGDHAGMEIDVADAGGGTRRQVVGRGVVSS